MASRSLRILTANLLHDHVDAARFGEILDESAPDVVAVQELGAAASAEIERRFDHHLLRAAAGSSGMGLALRHPGTIAVLELGGIAALRTVLTPGHWPDLSRPIELVNVHLANPVDWAPWQMVALRRRQVDRLRRQLDGTATALVAGDCNATPVWPAYRRISRFLQDGVLQSARTRGTRPQRTWGPVPGGPKVLRIDHCFTRGLQVVAAERIPIPGSDHAGLLAEITESG